MPYILLVEDNRIAMIAATRLFKQQPSINKIDQAWTMQQALELGAEGIALKTDPPRQTVEAIRQVAEGNVVYPQAVHNWLLRRARRGQQDDPATLTAREEQVLALIAEGLTNHKISRKLSVSEGRDTRG